MVSPNNIESVFSARNSVNVPSIKEDKFPDKTVAFSTCPYVSRIPSGCESVIIDAFATEKLPCCEG